MLLLLAFILSTVSFIKIKDKNNIENKKKLEMMRNQHNNETEDMVSKINLNNSYQIFIKRHSKLYVWLKFCLYV